MRTKVFERGSRFLLFFGADFSLLRLILDNFIFTPDHQISILGRDEYAPAVRARYDYVMIARDIVAVCDFCACGQVGKTDAVRYVFLQMDNRRALSRAEHELKRFRCEQGLSGSQIYNLVAAERIRRRSAVFYNSINLRYNLVCNLGLKTSFKLSDQRRPVTVASLLDTVRIKVKISCTAATTF